MLNFLIKNFNSGLSYSMDIGNFKIAVFVSVFFMLQFYFVVQGIFDTPILSVIVISRNRKRHYNTKVVYLFSSRFRLGSGSWRNWRSGYVSASLWTNNKEATGSNPNERFYLFFFYYESFPDLPENLN